MSTSGSYRPPPDYSESRVELQRSILQANNNAEFRAMLMKIKTATRMSFGQIGMRSGASRSSMHSLTSTKFDSLPTKELVVKFIAGCGLSKTQGEIVLGLHRKLELVEHELTKTSKDSSSSISSTTTTSGNDPVASQLHADLMQALREGGHWSVSDVGNGDPKVINIKVMPAEPPEPASRYWVRLWLSILDDDMRARRAVRLLLALASLVMVGSALLVFLVIQSPTAALPVATALATLAMLVPIAEARRRRSARSRSTS